MKHAPRGRISSSGKQSVPTASWLGYHLGPLRNGIEVAAKHQRSVLDGIRWNHLTGWTNESGSLLKGPLPEEEGLPIAHTRF